MVHRIYKRSSLNTLSYFTVNFKGPIDMEANNEMRYGVLALHGSNVLNKQIFVEQIKNCVLIRLDRTVSNHSCKQKTALCGIIWKETLQKKNGLLIFVIKISGDITDFVTIIFK